MSPVDARAVKQGLSKCFFEFCVGDGQGSERDFVMGGEHVRGHLLVRPCGGLIPRELAGVDLEGILKAEFLSLSVERDSPDGQGDATVNLPLGDGWTRMRSLDSLKASPSLGCVSEAVSESPSPLMADGRFYRQAHCSLDDGHPNATIAVEEVSSTTAQVESVLSSKTGHDIMMNEYKGCPHKDRVIARVPVQFKCEIDALFVRATAVLAFCILVRSAQSEDWRSLTVGNSAGAKLMASIVDDAFAGAGKTHFGKIPAFTGRIDKESSPKLLTSACKSSVVAFTDVSIPVECRIGIIRPMRASFEVVQADKDAALICVYLEVETGMEGFQLINVDLCLLEKFRAIPVSLIDRPDALLPALLTPAGGLYFIFKSTDFGHENLDGARLELQTLVRTRDGSIIVLSFVSECGGRRPLKGAHSLSVTTSCKFLF